MVGMPMYHQFYQFKENPFNVTADPEFFFSSRCHSDAISNLAYGINERKGILVVTGEVGTGKTTLCRTLIKQVNPHTQFALVLNPNFSEIQLLQMIINDLGITTKQKNKVMLIQELNHFLLKKTEQGCNVVIIIDEAQNLGIKQLENIRLLSNFETEKEKLLQIILVGQPELHQKLMLPELRQLRQRIAIQFHLEPLDKEDVKKYIEHRIIKASIAAQRIQFSDDAYHSIFQFTKGSPRTINVLCDRALLAGYAAETYFIDEFIIQNCAKEVWNL